MGGLLAGVLICHRGQLRGPPHSSCSSSSSPTWRRCLAGPWARGLAAPWCSTPGRRRA
ncbi:hypothetical protein JYU34_001508 [Plutella xylostella]|uniref:Uncharacterized protein n=1 Tax=Plutella xylostella TaxID=51655 RepID=A0ABQ7R434_PLUXY|nr:hypothetical protein JYU34_001508 [Plutella xylostella]